MLDGAPANERDNGLLRLLSPREAEVLANTSLGLSNDQIAARLNVTVHAVKFHLGAIYRKLGVANRTAASVVYMRVRQQHPERARYEIDGVE